MRRLSFLVILLCLSMIATACGGASSSNSTSTTSSTSTAAATSTVPTPAASPGASPSASPSGSTGSSTGSSTGAMTKVTLATGFMASMNSAPYYLAAEKGYYKDVGLDVTIKDGSNPALLQQVGSGDIDFGVTGGDSLIPARAAGIPVVMVMQQFQKYPVGLITLANGGAKISKPEDLKGKKIGVSAPNGSTYFGLLALLQAGHLSKNDVDIISIGFTELEALTQKRVDGAMTFVSNEPVQARALGTPVNELDVSDYMNLVSTGLFTSEKMIQDHPDVVQKFVEATMKGLAEAQSNPDEAAQVTLKRMPEVTGKNVQVQRDVLTATLKFEQQPSGHPYGWSDPSAWPTTVDLLKSAGVISKDVDPTSCYTDRFVNNAKP